MIIVKLCSNFQTIEIEVSDDADLSMKNPVFQKAVDLVNSFGQMVNYSSEKTGKAVIPQSSSRPEMATEKQIIMLVGAGWEEEDAASLTKRQAWKYCKEIFDGE